MLDIYSTEQKVSILTQIMKEESTGASLRDCCKAQGITLQTFIDWKARAQKHNQFDTLHLNGVHPERKPSRFRHEKPKTALQLALENAQRKHYPDDNPEDLHALEHGEPEPMLAAEVAPEPPPEPPTAAPLPVDKLYIPIEAREVASGPVIEPVYPIYDSVRSMLDKEPEPNPVNQSNEVIDMPKATESSAAGRPRGLSAVLHQRMPWLAALDKKTEKTMGPKPASKQPGYGVWIAARKALMTPEQIEEMEDFYGVNRRGPRTKMPPPPVAKKQPKPAQLAEQKEIVASRANGSRPVSPEIEALAEQHAHVSTQIAEHNRQPNREHAEIARLKKALMVLTLENLELRGLL